MGKTPYICAFKLVLGYYKVSLIVKKSVKRYDTDLTATIYARLRDGRQVDMVAPTNLSINPNLWDDKAEQVKSKIVCDDELRSFYNDEVRKIKSYLEKEYQSKEEEITKDWLKIALDKYYNPKKYYTEEEIAAEYVPTLTELFDDFPLEECTYGTPYYITIDERNKIYATNLKRHPQLAIQRDIFVFQCLIGCRVGDLIKMTKGNLINGAIEYIPRKTKEGRPLTVRVPLNATAQEIVARYKNCDGNKLLPFISEQKYNVAIKRIFCILAGPSN